MLVGTATSKQQQPSPNRQRLVTPTVLWVVAKTRPPLTRPSPPLTLTTIHSKGPSTDMETPSISREPTPSKLSRTTRSQPICLTPLEPCPKTEINQLGQRLKTFLLQEELLVVKLLTHSTTPCRNPNSTHSPVHPKLVIPLAGRNHLSRKSTRTPLLRFHSQSAERRQRLWALLTPLRRRRRRRRRSLPSCRFSLPTSTTRLTPFLSKTRNSIRRVAAASTMTLLHHRSRWLQVKSQVPQPDGTRLGPVPRVPPPPGLARDLQWILIQCLGSLSRRRRRLPGRRHRRALH